MTERADDGVGLSVVVPVYRGAEYLEELVALLDRLRQELVERGAPLVLREAVFVDDASADGSLALLARLAEDRPWLRTVALSRNFGQHAATAAGIRCCGGDWIATIDEDLQHEPRFLLPLLARAVVERADVAYASPRGAVHRTRYRDLSSRFFKGLMTRVAGNPHTRSFNSFRMIRGEVARAAAAVMRQESYLDVTLGWFTDRVVVQPLPLLDRRDVTGKQSGYGLLSLLRHARRMLVSSQLKPLRLGGAVGFAALFLSLVGAVAVVALKLVAPGAIAAQGWASLIVAVFFFGGLSAVLLGVVLEYMTILLLDSQGRPSSFGLDRRSDERLAGFLREFLVD